MNPISDKIEYFYHAKFPLPSYTHSMSSQKIYQLPIKEQKLALYRNVSQTYPKSIKQYGFMKKYSNIVMFLPYVSSWRPIQLQLKHIIQIITIIYNTYSQYIKWGWWKQQQHETYLQQFLLMVLDSTYSLEKNKSINTFDKYLLAFFYTLNVKKSDIKLIRNFSSFLNETYPPGYFFLYICLRSNAEITEDSRTVIKSDIFKKIIKILQTESKNNSIISSPIISNFNSLNTQTISHSKETILYDENQHEQDFDVDLELFFQTPIAECFAIPKVKMYRIMNVCGLIRDKVKQCSLSWQSFLQAYFGQQQIDCQDKSFQHLISVSVAKATYQIGQKLIENQNNRHRFLESTFSYVFQILQMIFQQKQPEINDFTTKQNILSLKKAYKSIKNLNNYGITVLNKFTKRILKNNYILNLYKEYCD